jgi:PAS domain S-box-containing protein
MSGRLPRAAVAAAWTYAGLAALALSLCDRLTACAWIEDWVALPLQGFALILVTVLLVGPSRPGRPRPQGLTRAGWWGVFAFTVLGVAATSVGNFSSPADDTTVTLSFPAGVYLMEYASLACAFALFFASVGGSFRRVQTWLDLATLTALPLAALWTFLWEPTVASGGGGGITVAAKLAYALTLSCMSTMAALFLLRLTGLRGRSALLLLVGAVAACVIQEMVWLATWLADRDYNTSFYYFGDVVCFAAVSSSAALSLRAPRDNSTAVSPARVADNFLPVLAVLVSSGLIARFVASTRRWDGSILVGLVALAALLLITRQRSAHKELQALHRQLAHQEADRRLTELVRRSADLILLADADARVSFASPAIESMLGVAATTVHGTPVVDLLGPAYRSLLGDFLERVRTPNATASVIELRVLQATGAIRVLKLSAADQIADPSINAIVMNFTDVTEQRMLEREVLDVAARERVKLSGDIHDGLGQQLAGISMLLHSAASMPHRDPAAQRLKLDQIVQQLNIAVGASRDLARGLSPLHVVRGSLSAAMGTLARMAGASVDISLDVDAAFDERVLEDSHADHLYRIAEEAVSNSRRHSGCSRIGIALRHTGLAIVLEITDDGRGIDELATGYPGLGLRLMEYRARLAGGALRVDSAPGAGTRVEMIIPLDSIAAPRVRETS